MSVICNNCRWVTIWYTRYSILYTHIAYIGKQLPRKCLWPILCVPIDTSRLIKPVSRRVFMRLSRCFLFIILIARTCETINRCVKKKCVKQNRTRNHVNGILLLNIYMYRYMEAEAHGNVVRCYYVIML